MPQLPAGEGQASAESEVPEEAMERLAHLEQLVVQLKELIRDKDTQLVQKDTELANKDAQLKVNNPACFLSAVSSKKVSSLQCVLHASIFFLILHILRMKRKKLRLDSPNSNCRPKLRWLHSTNR